MRALTFGLNPPTWGVWLSTDTWVTWLSPDTFSEYVHGPCWDGVRNTGKDDAPSRPLCTPFSILALVFKSAHSETCLAVLALIPCFEAGVGITADFSQYSGLRARFFGLSHSAKGVSLRVASASVVCHLNCWRAETTTSSNFKVLSAFQSSHSSSFSCSSTLNLKLLSDSKSQVSAWAAFTMLKKTSWSCHKRNNTCQIKVSLHRINYLHLTEQLSAHIFNIIRCISNCGLFHHNPLTWYFN